MSWETILKTPAWAPLRQVAPDGKMVFPGVFRVMEEAYLVTQPYNQAFEENHVEAPFVTMAIWAGSLSAVKRCFNSDAEVQIHAGTAKPPATLIFGTNGKYGELVQCVPREKLKLAERAVYSNTGGFVHKVIQIDRFRFCYLNPTISMEDEVYAIEVTLY